MILRTKSSAIAQCQATIPATSSIQVTPGTGRTIGVQWSPVRGDNNILLTVQLPEEGRNALAIVQAVREPLYSENAPQFTRYDYGTWNPGGQGITVSGRRPDHRVVIAVVNNNLSGEQVVLDGSARGLWLRDAVRLPNGQYRALGRPRRSRQRAGRAL